MDQEPQTARERAVLLLRAALVPGWLPRWLPTSGFQRLVWTIRIAIVLVIALFIFPAFDKGLWDWLQLLIVPAALALGVARLTWAQRQREHEAEEAQQERERKAEEDRRERERVALAAQRERELDVQNQRAQDEAIQVYLDQMSTLLLEKDLRNAEEDSEVRLLARARTLSTLPVLSSERQRRALRFLKEMKLIQALQATEEPVISLRFARLDGIDMRRRGLLSGANLTQASLTNADLRRANLTDSRLRGARFDNAKLTNAILTRADLTGARGITNEDLVAQAKSLKDAIMPNGQKYEDWLKDREGHGEVGEDTSTP